MSTSPSQNAGRSSGLRLEIRVLGPPVQMTTSSSDHLPPALAMLVLRLGQDVMAQSESTSASTRVHGP